MSRNVSGPTAGAPLLCAASRSRGQPNPGVAELAAGLTYGVAAGDVGGKPATVVASAAAQLPAAWLLAAVTSALLSVAPGFTPVAWGVLAEFIAVHLLGSLSGLPHWLLDLDPFAHILRVGGGSFSPAPLLWLLAIDAALVALEVAAFRRRDVRFVQ
jgi:ABC-2 type transport system permease protein